MQKVFNSIFPLVVETDDVENLTNVILKDLEVNDVIIEANEENGKNAYKIIYKNDEEMRFSAVDETSVKVVIYTKSNGVWSYSETKTTELGGGTKLYMHKVVVTYDTTNSYQFSYDTATGVSSITQSAKNGTETVVILSTNPTAFTQISQLFDKNNIAPANLNNSGWFGGFLARGYYTGIFYIEFSLTATNFIVRRHNITFTSDVVTPL